VRRLQADMTAFFDELYTGEEKRLVFGDGDIHSRIMLIGEAPGEQESLQGRPFVGKAGKNLDEFLLLSGLDRRTLYISNTVKFRPTKISKAGRIVNRPPSQEEIRLSVPWLEREIGLVDPDIIVTLGNVSLKALLGKEASVGQCHGRWQEWNGRRLYPLYHPASILYNPSLREVYREDVVRLGQDVRASD